MNLSEYKEQGMSHDIMLSTRTAAQMADLLKRLSRNHVEIVPDVTLEECPVAGIIPEQTSEQKQPEEQLLSAEIRDTSGVLFDSAIHSTRRDGSPSFKQDGTFKTRRRTKASEVGEQSQATVHTLKPPDNNRPQLYVCKDANGNKFPGSTVGTSRDFVIILIEQLKGARGEDVRSRILDSNKDALARLREDGEDALLMEIDNIELD